MTIINDNSYEYMTKCQPFHFGINIVLY